MILSRSEVVENGRIWMPSNLPGFEKTNSPSILEDGENEMGDSQQSQPSRN